MTPLNWSLAGSQESMPVRNIYAIGWNYPLHNEELNRRRDEPLIVFLKSGGTILPPGEPLPYPPNTQELHYEGELVVLIGKEGYRISAAEAQDYVWGYAPGIDFTLRDVQWRVRGKGQPWFPAKNFRGASAVGEFQPAAAVGDVAPLHLQLSVNGLTRQDSLLSAMNHGAASLIELLSANLPLLRGDAIFTGTPQGVGECSPGDEVVCRIERIGAVQVRVAA
jgi:fumarylpyruvate hydrolase